MTETVELSGPDYGPKAGGAPGQIVLMLHGRGANGDDLIGLAPHLADAMPEARFVAPNAPQPCDFPFGGYQWFHIAERTPENFLDGTRAAAAGLDALIDKELARHDLAAHRMALLGFSQGTMMSLFVGLRRTERLACILGFSGRLVGVDVLKRELRSRPPVCLITGDADELIGPEALPEAVAGLKGAGVSVQSHVRPGLGHNIDAGGIAIGTEFLTRNLGLSPTVLDIDR
jgi:phospholipase/carboxylesterase